MGWVWKIFGTTQFSANRKDYPDLDSVTSSVWNFDARSSYDISPGNQPWHGEMAAVYAGYTIIETYLVRKPYKEKALRSFKEKLVRI